jgi:chorismate mutase/prephenate dehydratase
VDLKDLRVKIDLLDTELIRLLNERAELVHAVGEIKRAQGLEIYAPEREEQLLNALAAKNHSQGGRLPALGLRAIYREIMSASLALEKDIAIAYFGPEATWTHQAARNKFGASVRYLSQASIGDVFDAVERGRADYGVVPIENSTEGAVNHTLDMFIESELRICAQITLPIEHHLMANIPRESIRRIFSHPQVFGQCRRWLHEHCPGAELVEVSSTSRAGDMAAQSTDGAALAGRMVAELYRLAILDEGVQDSASNTTRFLVIGARDCPPTGQDRTSLMFSVPDRAGTLFAALEPLQSEGLSMSKIESRPSKRKPWEYVFFVDVEGHRLDEKMVAALKELEGRCTFLKILGSYPKAGGQPAA